MRPLLAVLLCAPLAAEEALACVQLNHELPALAAAAGSLGLQPRRSPWPAEAHRLVVLEAAGQDLPREQVEALGERLRLGGGLLVTIAARPGKSAFALTPLLPTTAWQSLLPEAHRGEAPGAVASGEGDVAFFGGTVPQLRLPWYWRLRALHAAERGESRYEVMERKQAYVGWPMRPGEPFHSRPLLNRDWRERLAADDGRASALLVTGSYGAGRTAVIACAAAEVPEALWRATLAWLAQAVPGTAPAAPELAPRLAVDGRALVVRARNPGAEPLRLPVVARLATIDGAMLQDLGGELALPAGAEGELRLDLPQAGPHSAQALAEEGVLQVRAGILAPEGRALWWEGRLRADLRPELSLAVATDELRAVKRTFHAPVPGSLKLPDRGGSPVAAYARAPGETVQVAVTAGNGARNLAPLATLTASNTDPGLAALSDGMVSRAGPRDGYRWWGRWQAEAGKDHELRYAFAAPVTICRIVLLGGADPDRDGWANPGAATVLLDGTEVIRADDLDVRFAAGRGRAELAPAAAVSGRELVIRLPWLAQAADGGKRGPLRLAEVELIGCSSPVPAPRGVAVDVALEAAGRQPIPVGRVELTVPGGDRATATLTCSLPADPLVAWRVVARTAGATAEQPLLQIAPTAPLKPVSDLTPGGKVFETGTIVTRGVRTYLPWGTGSRDTAGNWGEPEDLVFCYARNLKQTGAGAKTHAGKLWLSEHDFRHYVNPWTSLPSGEPFFSVAAPSFIAMNAGKPAFADAATVTIFHSDRWDTGPSVANLYTWQELVEFDRWLGEQGLPRLSGRTRAAVVEEIRGAHQGRLHAWQLQRYLAAVRSLRGAVEGAGKRLNLRGQGIPLVPLAAVGELASTYRGMTDDNTWGARREDYAFTAGVQMAIKAFNPAWQLGTTFCWGWDSAVLSNPHWYSPVGITETSRRHAAIRAWRGSIQLDGTYGSMFSYGYGMNGYAPFTVRPAEWQENWNAAERWSLIAPDGPIGAGVAISTARLDDPARTIFSGGGMGGSGDADHLADGVAELIGLLHHAGVSVPFAANAAAIAAWKGSAPLVCLDVDGWSEAERAQLRAWADRGVPLVLFGPLPADLAALAEGATAAGFAVDGKEVLTAGNRILVPAAAAALAIPEANRLAALMQRVCDLPIAYPPGIAGYGFTMAGRRFLTVEDWRERGGEVEVRLRATGSAASATALSAHRPLAVRRDGRDWLITVPLRPADGELVLVEETP